MTVQKFGNWAKTPPSGQSTPRKWRKLVDYSSVLLFKQTLSFMLGALEIKNLNFGNGMIWTKISKFQAGFKNFQKISKFFSFFFSKSFPTFFPSYFFKNHNKNRLTPSMIGTSILNAFLLKLTSSVTLDSKV